MSGIPIDDRMKMYEEASRHVLTPRMPMIIRVDGRAFHTLTRGLDPWDPMIARSMERSAIALFKEIAGAELAYTQSDEISVLVNDFRTLGTQPWFGKVLQKVASVSASIATAHFRHTGERGQYATFDARAFVIPREEVTNYFIWRQQDATKNSVSMLAQQHFPHSRLQGLNGSQMQDLLHAEKGINWNDLPVWQRRGIVVKRGFVDFCPPIFTQDRNYIEQHLTESEPS